MAVAHQLSILNTVYLTNREVRTDFKAKLAHVDRLRKCGGGCLHSFGHCGVVVPQRPAHRKTTGLVGAVKRGNYSEHTWLGTSGVSASQLETGRHRKCGRVLPTLTRCRGRPGYSHNQKAGYPKDTFILHWYLTNMCHFQYILSQDTPYASGALKVLHSQLQPSTIRFSNPT